MDDKSLTEPSINLYKDLCQPVPNDSNRKLGQVLVGRAILEDLSQVVAENLSKTTLTLFGIFEEGRTTRSSFTFINLRGSFQMLT